MALLIRGGQVLNSAQMALEPADVLIEADHIVAVGCKLSCPPGTEELSATGYLVLPGLANAHTHAHNNLFKGLADNWTLEDLLTHGPAVSDVVFYRVVPDLFEILPPDLRQTVEQIQADPTAGLLQLTENALRLWHGAAGGRIRVAVAPTIPGQCSDDFLLGCGRLAQEYGVGLHTHLAESKVQAVYAQRRWGTTIVGHLADL